MLVNNIRLYVDRIKVGDGMLENTTMGPLASKAQFEIVHRYVRQGIESGLKLVVGENLQRIGRMSMATITRRGVRPGRTGFAPG